jgi:hypothetical protein
LFTLNESASTALSPPNRFERFLTSKALMICPG